jgi:phosphoribosylaminoimidazolecarboxamide formyltransferase/IMP cyclohydrolase
LIADYLTRQTGERYPERLTLTYERQQPLRYGENPHQSAAFYREPFAPRWTIAGARQLHGKELSYNNIQDADAALSLVHAFDLPTVVAVKHTNPCGVGFARTIQEAYEKAYQADPVSIFGGIVAFNRPVNDICAARMAELFLEIVLAPGFSPEALSILGRKKNVRLLAVSPPVGVAVRPRPYAVRSVDGGLLVQDRDDQPERRDDWQVATERTPTDAEWRQLLFAEAVVKHVKSNAIVLAREDRTVGVGAGQMNRVGAAEIAIRQAGDLAHGSVLASDAFFPMRDTLDAAAAAGITAIIQPGGSIRDAESIEAANAAGIAMVFTGTRHFRH